MLKTIWGKNMALQSNSGKKIWKWFAKQLLPSCKDFKNAVKLSQNTVKATRRNFP